MIHTIIPYIYLVIGGCFFLYFMILWIYCGRIPAFGWFWPVIGTVMGLLGLFTMDYSRVTPDGMTVVIYDERTAAFREFCIQRLPVILLVLAVIFLIGIWILSSHGKKKASPGADYVIVLGAHVNGSVPSKALMSRIMAACDYLKDNPQTQAVLTGGKGRGEDITEASCMKQELLQLGISEERLLVEEKSTTTKENITFARKIIMEEDDRLSCDNKDRNINYKKEPVIIVVTSDFHALRGKRIAEQVVNTPVETISCTSLKIMKLHYYTRELLSWTNFLFFK